MRASTVVTQLEAHLEENAAEAVALPSVNNAQAAQSPAQKAQNPVSPQRVTANDVLQRESRRGVEAGNTVEPKVVGESHFESPLPDLDPNTGAEDLANAVNGDTIELNRDSGNQSTGQSQQLAIAATSMDITIPVSHTTSSSPSNENDTWFADHVDNQHFTAMPPSDDWQIQNPADLLDSWLFPCDLTSLLTPLPDLMPGLLLPAWDGSSQYGVGHVQAIPPQNFNEETTPSGRFASLISKERFGKIQGQWHSRSSRATRLMPSLWQDLAVSERQNICCKQVPQISHPDVRHRRVSRWGFDDECRQQMQLTLNSLTQAGGVYSPQSSGSTDHDHRSHSGSIASYSGGVTLPSTETCEVALEIYFHQFHPMLPVIHLPTFSAKGAPFPMLFVLCLLGFSILGTPSATNLVSDTFLVSSMVAPRSMFLPGFVD